MGSICRRGLENVRDRPSRPCGPSARAAPHAGGMARPGPERVEQDIGSRRRVSQAPRAAGMLPDNPDLRDAATGVCVATGGARPHVVILPGNSHPLLENGRRVRPLCSRHSRRHPCGNYAALRGNRIEASRRTKEREATMLKIIGWIILVIFIIGLLVVVGFFKLIF